MFRCFFFPIEMKVNYYMYPGFSLHEELGILVIPDSISMIGEWRPFGTIPSVEKS